MDLDCRGDDLVEGEVGGDDLYCRAYNGTSSHWYQAARREGHEHISVGGVEKDVDFEFVTDDAVIDQVDASYRTKHHDSPYLQPILGSRLPH